MAKEKEKFFICSIITVYTPTEVKSEDEKVDFLRRLYDN
jgi:hypothetical protein